MSPRGDGGRRAAEKAALDAAAAVAAERLDLDSDGDQGEPLSYHLPRLGAPLQTNYAGKCTGEASAGGGGPRGDHQRGVSHSVDATKYSVNAMGKYNILTNGSRECASYPDMSTFRSL